MDSIEATTDTAWMEAERRQIATHAKLALLEVDATMRQLLAARACVQRAIDATPVFGTGSA